MMRTYQKDRGQPEGAPAGHIGVNLSIKINNNSNELSPLNKIKTDESLLMQINKGEGRESSSLQQNAN